MVYPYNGINDKKDQTIDTLDKMDESQNNQGDSKKPEKRVHNTWFHVHKALEIGKLTYSDTVVAWEKVGGSSAGKGSALNAGHPGSIPGSGRSNGEGNGNPCQYSWASLVAQTVKNPPVMWEICLIPKLGRSSGGGHDNPLQYSCLKNPHGQRSLAGYSPWGCTELDMTERLSTAF